MENNLYYHDGSPAIGTMDMRTFLNRVFLYMSIGLAITAVLAYAFAHSAPLFSIIFNIETGKPTIFGYIAMFAPLLLVMVMSFAFEKLSYTTLLALFILYTAITGISLSSIFLIYTASTIYKTFLGTSLLFATMAIIGYTTKQDLSSFGRILMMLLVGVIICSIINYFTKSSTFDYIISFVGVAIFTGLTAYDMQKLKHIAQSNIDSQTKSKLALSGALSLYLDFINLFLLLLRLFGGRKSD